MVIQILLLPLQYRNKTKYNNKNNKTMKTIKATTKAGQAFINRYNRATAATLSECYRQPSSAKVRAEFLCRMQAGKEGGTGYKIISHNCNFFSVAWKTSEGLRIETAYNSILVTE